MHRPLSSACGVAIVMAIGFAISCSASPLPLHPKNNGPLGRPAIMARPPASFENAKPISGRPFGAGAAGLRQLPSAIHRAYMINPLTKEEKQTLLGGGAHPMLLTAQMNSYASLSPSHEVESGRADIVILAPLMVTSNSQEEPALFGPSSMSMGPFSSSLKLTVTSPGPGYYLADIVIFPTDIFAPAPDTVSFDIIGANGAQQTVPISGALAPQHLNFLINATAAGDYPYSISTKDSDWIFTTCTVTKISGQ